jgi:hypothetical protein
VSIGEDRRGALIVNRRVTVVSKETSDAGKALHETKISDRCKKFQCFTDRAWQNEEVIVGQGSMAVGVEESIDVEAISGRILLEHLQSLAVILDFDHNARRNNKYRNKNTIKNGRNEEGELFPKKIRGAGGRAAILTGGPKVARLAKRLFGLWFSGTDSYFLS